MTPQSFGKLKQGKITFGLDLSNFVPQRTVCKENKKAVMMTTAILSRVTSLSSRLHRTRQGTHSTS